MDRCIVGVHLGPEWEFPSGYEEDVRDYVESTSADFISIGYSPYDDGDYADMADASFESDGRGRLDEPAVDHILQQYDTIEVIGGYWGACHKGVWDSIVSGVYEDARNSSYDIIFPADKISDVSERVSDKFAAHRADTPFGTIGSTLPWETIRDPADVDGFHEYVASVEEAKEVCGGDYTYTVEEENGPAIRWTFDGSEQ